MKLTSCTGVWAVRGAGGTGPKGAGPNGAKGAKGGAAWGAKGGAGTCAANIGPWRTFEFDCINSCDGYTVIYKIVYIYMLHKRAEFLSRAKALSIQHSNEHNELHKI